MIVEDQNMSDCFATYGDRPRQDREDFLRSFRCCIRQPVDSKIHHSFLNPSNAHISENFENLQTADPPTHEATPQQVTRDDRDERRPLSVLVSLDWSGRIETEKENDQHKDYWRYAHGFLHHRKKIARTRKPSRTPSNGLETANQKETFQSEVVEFIFTLFSQAFEDRHFTKI